MKTQPMFAAVYIPNFSLQAALRHEPDLRSQAVALIDSELSKPAIVQLNLTARQHGVVEGQTASQATARCENLIIKTSSAAQEKSATDILQQTAYAFSPNIEDTAPGVCTMELKGLGLETTAPRQKWTEDIRQTLTQFHLEVQIGIAPTPALALIAARAADSVLIVENVDKFISDLPLRALNPPLAISEILTRWGIQTVGAFIALEKDNLSERLGTDALELFERVSTDFVRPLKLVSPPEYFSEQIEFENEIETLEPLLFILHRFVEQLARRLETIHLVVAEFQLQLGLSNGAKHSGTFKIPSPTGDVRVLFRMLQTHLESVRTDATIVSLKLDAKQCKPEIHQFGLFETTLRDPNQFAETFARLTALCGPQNVGTPMLEATNKPDSFHIAVPQFDSTAIPNPTSQIPNFKTCLRRFRPPLMALIEFRVERPALIRSNLFSGAIAGARGPFLSSGDWWDERRWGREEWDVETADGSVLRIFRASDGCFLEGVYD